jgi:hypothetical protein
VGFAYDSSLMMRSSAPFMVRPGLIEIPVTSVGIGERRAPMTGGFTFRAIPYFLYKRLQKEPMNFYFHTWEVYTDYPRIPLPILKKFIQYYNLAGSPKKLSRLLSDNKFTTIQDALTLGEV